MSRIIISLISITFFSWLIKKQSDKLTNQFETLKHFQVSSELCVGQGGDNNKKITHKDIFWKRFALANILLYIYVIIGIIIGYLLIFFHEIGHLLTAISFNMNIIEVFLSPLYGHVILNGEIPVIQHTIIALSGGLGVIITGTFFLFLLHWNDKLALTLHAPLNIIITYAVWENLRYFCQGAITLTNDIGLIIQLNPEINPSLILYFCLVGMVLVILFSAYSLFQKGLKKKVSYNEVQKSRT